MALCKGPGRPTRLTAIEWETALLVGSGWPAGAVARRRGVSESTVRKQLAEALRKVALTLPDLRLHLRRA